MWVDFLIKESERSAAAAVVDGEAEAVVATPPRSTQTGTAAGAAAYPDSTVSPLPPMPKAPPA
jgi:hypothetical protein